MSVGDRIGAFIERECHYGDRYVGAVRVLYGVFFALANVPVIIGMGYAVARAPGVFTLPIVAPLASIPVWLHQALVYALVPLALLYTADRLVPAASIAIASILLYLLLFDYFAFRHMWFLHANAFFLWAWIAWPARADAQSPRPYAIFAYRLLICCVYWFAALAKMNHGFLAGHAIEAMVVQQWGAGSPVYGLLSAHSWLWPVFAWLGLLGELVLPALLLVPRTRILGVVAGCGFHVAVLGITRQGPSLHIMMMLSYLLFIREPADGRLMLRNPIFALWAGLGVLFAGYVFVKYFV